MAFAYQKLGALLPFVPKESKSASYHLCVLREQAWGEHGQFPSKELRNHCSRSACTERMVEEARSSVRIRRTCGISPSICTGQLLPTVFPLVSGCI